MYKYRYGGRPRKGSAVSVYTELFNIKITMTNFFTRNIQKNIAVAVMGIALCFGMFAGASQTQAQTQSQEMQEQINTLLALIASLQEQIESGSGGGASEPDDDDTHASTDRFEVGATVVTTDRVQVRSNLVSWFAQRSVQDKGAVGEIIGGPSEYRGYTYWEIAYENGWTGWSAENWLKAESKFVDNESSGELQISVSSNSPDSSSIVVEYDDVSDLYTVLVLEIEERNGVDVVIEDITFDVDTDDTTASFTDIIDEAVLYYQGSELGSADVSVNGLIAFENIGLDVDSDSSVELVVKLGFEEAERYESGTRIDVSFERIDGAEDENGNDEGDMIISGSASGEEHSLISSGAVVDVTSVSEEVAGNTAEFEFEFEVEALGEDIYIYRNYDGKDGSVQVFIEQSSNDKPAGEFTTSLTSSANTSGAYYVVEEGETEDFTITANFEAESLGSFRVSFDNFPYLISQAGGRVHYVTVDEKTRYVIIAGDGTDSNDEDEDQDEEEDEEDISYDIEITHPRKNDNFYSGDVVQLNWRESNLEYEEAIVTLERNNYSVHLRENVDVGDQGVRVQLPEYQELGLTEEATYDLKLWVSYVKDGSPKAVADTVSIKVVPRFASTDEDEDQDEDEDENEDQDEDEDEGVAGISVGDTVVVTRGHWAKDRLAVFFSGHQSIQKGSKGEVVDGPRNFAGSQWWRVKYENKRIAYSPASSIAVMEGEVLGASTSIDAYQELQAAMTSLNAALLQYME